MIADRPHPQTLPLLSAFLCVLGAGFATSFVFQLQTPWASRLAGASSPLPTTLVFSLVGALAAAWALRLLLRGVCGFVISYWRAYGALVAGDLVGVVFVAALLGFARHTAGTAATAVLPTMFGPQLLGLILSVHLVQRAAVPLGHRPPPVVRAGSPAGERDRYDEAVSAVRDASLGLADLLPSVPPGEAPDLIANGLERLDAAAGRLEREGCPVPELADCHARLVRALRELERELRDAVTYRRPLGRSEALEAVRDALDELGRRGIGTTW